MNEKEVEVHSVPNAIKVVLRFQDVGEASEFFSSMSKVEEKHQPLAMHVGFTTQKTQPEASPLKKAIYDAARAKRAHYTRVKPAERRFIRQLKREGFSTLEIMSKMGRAASSVRRALGLCK